MDNPNTYCDHFLRASAQSFGSACGLPRGCLTNILEIPGRTFAKKTELLLSRIVHTRARAHTHAHYALFSDALKLAGKLCMLVFPSNVLW